MSPTWMSEEAPARAHPGMAGRGRLILRAVPLVLLVFGGLLVMLLLRLIERPLFGQARPWTPFITVFVCRTALRIMGLPVTHHGTPMVHPGAIVANHSSWLDIFALNSAAPLYFVSKSEVAQWPGIGWLARATGTMFVNRRKREAAAQKTLFEARLAAGHRLLFFPEGTSTDGQRVLPFKSTLFAGLMAESAPKGLWVQPVTVAYRAPDGEDARFYGWWGDMSFTPHLAQVLAQAGQGQVDVTWHAPLEVAAFSDRKALARDCEEFVRTAHFEASTS